MTHPEIGCADVAPSAPFSSPVGRTFVFIAGLHRSGTSVLFKCLKEHPAISGFDGTGVTEDEGQLLQTVYPPARVHGGPGRFGFDADAHLTETSPLASPANAHELFRQWSPRWDLAKPVLVEKSPPNLIRTRFLQALYPTSFFIVILRHPIAVSYATQKWSGTELHSLLRHWIVCHRIYEADAPLLRRVLTLKYEHFVSDPSAAFDRILRFLGLPPQAITTPVRPGVNDAYFARWRNRRGKALKRAYLTGLELMYERAVRHFGYSLRDLQLVQRSGLEIETDRAD
jgi:sulfotransferase family protein